MKNKYRMWHKKEKNMYLVNCLARELGKPGVLVYPRFFETIQNNIIKYSTESGDIVLMQSTGLQDKNGEMIFEGDILESTRPAKERYLVVWDEKDAAFYAKDLDSETRWKIPNNGECVVIGDVYRNPELIDQ